MMHDAAPFLTLHPVLASPGRPTWEGAEWVGEVWVDVVDAVAASSDSTGLPVQCGLEAAEGYRQARLLVRTEDRTLGFVKIGVSNGNVDFLELERRIAGMRPTASTAPESGGSGETRRGGAVAVTVVMCTRDRPAMLRVALESVLAVDYPDFETIVVDNASKTDATREYVLKLSHPRVKLIYEPRPGASRARNAGLLAASGDVVAFVDDDVVVDRYWLRALVNGFTRGPSVSCVSGIVPAAEIRTPAQAYFDRRVGWSDSTRARVYDWACPPPDVPLFPFAVRCYGTGASFAVERDVAVHLGGFDELLGPGTTTCGGEDLDLFFRILRSGRQLVHDPAAIAWHRHRADNEALLAQTRGYGLGLGAWLAKIAHEPETAWLAVKTAAIRAPALVRHLRGASTESAPPASLAHLLPSGIGDETLRFIGEGARAYRSARRDKGRPERRRPPHVHGAASVEWVVGS